MPPASNMELNRLPESIDSERLLDDVRSLVEKSRCSLAKAVNSELVLLYWHIGRRISEDLPAENRAEYGAKVVELVSQRLTMEYGKGFRRSNVFHMIRFAEVFDDVRIVQTLSGLLSWSHFIEIIYLKDPLQRQFYAEMARVERWSVRTLRQKIQGMLYERTAISRKPEELARQELEALSDEDRMTPDLPGPLSAGLPGAGGHLQRARSGGGHTEGAGEVPAGAGHGLLLHRPSEAHDHRRPGLLPRPALLPPRPAPSGGH